MSSTNDQSNFSGLDNSGMKPRYGLAAAGRMPGQNTDGTDYSASDPSTTDPSYNSSADPNLSSSVDPSMGNSMSGGGASQYGSGDRSLAGSGAGGQYNSNNMGGSMPGAGNTDFADAPPRHVRHTDNQPIQTNDNYDSSANQWESGGNTGFQDDQSGQGGQDGQDGQGGQGGQGLMGKLASKAENMMGKNN